MAAITAIKHHFKGTYPNTCLQLININYFLCVKLQKAVVFRGRAYFLTAANTARHCPHHNKDEEKSAVHHLYTHFCF